MFSWKFCGIFKNTFFIELFLAANSGASSIKIDKNVYRYCNKDIKVISNEAILVSFCQLWKWFCMLRKLWKPASRKTYQYLRNLQGKHLWWSFVTVKPVSLRFTVILLMILKLIILWNFILKLFLRSWSLLFSSWIAWAELWSANH